MKGKYILSVPNFWKNNIQIKIPIYSQNSGLKPKPVYRIGANYAYLLPTTHLPFFSGKKKKILTQFSRKMQLDKTGCMSHTEQYLFTAI